MPRSWNNVKPKTPVLGIDDTPFTFKARDVSIPVIGVIMKGSSAFEGCLQGSIMIDAFDVTTPLIELIETSSHKGQLRVIMTDGLTLAGFGIIDIHSLVEKTGIPVIAITSRFPDFNKIKSALLTHFEDGKERWDLLKRAGTPIHYPKTNIYLQIAGMPVNSAFQLIEYTTCYGRIPEPVRIAHLIARSFKNPSKE